MVSTFELSCWVREEEREGLTCAGFVDKGTTESGGLVGEVGLEGAWRVGRRGDMSGVEVFDEGPTAE